MTAGGLIQTDEEGFAAVARDGCAPGGVHALAVFECAKAMMEAVSTINVRFDSGDGRSEGTGCVCVGGCRCMPERLPTPLASTNNEKLTAANN